MTTRREHDALGDFAVPADAYYGIATARAVENFPISGLRMPRSLVHATAHVKAAAAAANVALGRLDAEVGRAITAAADEVLDGRHDTQFVVDVFQAGAGTSHHMNVNEVLANRAEEILGGRRGEYRRVHPNDHVNLGQSTNDVFPTAIRLALYGALRPLLDAVDALASSFDRKASAFAQVLKVGRTHLTDAVPMTLGQELGGYAAVLRHTGTVLTPARAALLEVNLGATAIGTGLNAGRAFQRHAIAGLAARTGWPLTAPQNAFRVTQSMADVLVCANGLRTIAVEGGKICNDLRLLAMGPRAGLAEIVLPAVQPGSSIMPGKINPSILEMVNQVCFQVLGCDAAIAAAAGAGQLELNVMMPVIGANALFATTILTQALDVWRTRAVDGLAADAVRARALLDGSTALATALAPHLGYAETARLVRLALDERRPIEQVVEAEGLIAPERLAEILAVEGLTEPADDDRA